MSAGAVPGPADLAALAQTGPVPALADDPSDGLAVCLGCHIGNCKTPLTPRRDPV